MTCWPRYQHLSLDLPLMCDLLPMWWLNSSTLEWSVSHITGNTSANIKETVIARRLMLLNIIFSVVCVQFTIDVYWARGCRADGPTSILSHLCSHGDVCHVTVTGSDDGRCSWVWSKTFSGNCTKVSGRLSFLLAFLQYIRSLHYAILCLTSWLLLFSVLPIIFSMDFSFSYRCH